MAVVRFKKGDVIIKEGAMGTSAYSISSGKVEVSGEVNGQKAVFATLGEKDIFGEMGLIENKPRSATITALVDTELQEITRDGFNETFHKNPKVLLPIVRALFERLRTATRMAAAKIAAANLPAQDASVTNDDDDRYVTLVGETEFAKQAMNDEPLDIKKFPFKIGRYTSGRDDDVLSDNDFSIKENSPPFYVSRNHMLLDKIDGNFVVIDRGSRTGTIVDGKKLDGPHIISKDKISITVGSAYSPFSFETTVKSSAVTDKGSAKAKGDNAAFSYVSFPDVPADDEENKQEAPEENKQEAPKG